ncbi:MAG: hypothetical protein ACKVIW_08735 [bacterium]
MTLGCVIRVDPYGKNQIRSNLAVLETGGAVVQAAVTRPSPGAVR